MLHTAGLHGAQAHRRSGLLKHDLRFYTPSDARNIGRDDVVGPGHLDELPGHPCRAAVEVHVVGDLAIAEVRKQAARADEHEVVGPDSDAALPPLD